MERQNDVVIVDSHQHFWDPGELNLPPMSPETQVLNRAYMPENLAKEIKTAGVDYTVLVQGLPQEIATNDWYFQKANNCDFVAGVVAWVNLLESASIGTALDRLQREPKFVGVRHIIDLEPDVDWMVQTAVIEGFCEIARRRIPFDMCVNVKHLENVLKILDRVNDLQVVIDHIAKPAIAKGGIPACVEACSSQALTFGKRDQLIRTAYKRISDSNGTYVNQVYGEHEAGGTSWLYLSPVPFEDVGLPDIRDGEYGELTWGFLTTIGAADILLPLAMISVYRFAQRRNQIAEEKGPNDPAVTRGEDDGSGD